MAEWVINLRLLHPVLQANDVCCSTANSHKVSAIVHLAKNSEDEHLHVILNSAD